MGEEVPPHRFDFVRYLQFLEEHRHNFIRLWAWELVDAASDRYPRRRFAAPQPWMRTGPGRDAAGLPRFDLNRHNPAYFDRLYARVAEAQSRGFYVSVMLFEGWGVRFSPGRATHPFARRNNINGIECGNEPASIHTMRDPAINAIQRSYAMRVVKTVNEFDQVIFEIINEGSPETTEWQYGMIQFVKSLERDLPKQHLVGMTFQYPGGKNATLFESDADWISPGPESGGYRADPEPADGSKVIIADTDHLGGSAAGDRRWVWKSFMRGLHTVFMDRYLPPDSVADEPYAKADEVRSAMGQTVGFARRLDLNFLVPSRDAASSGYALVGEDQLIAYLPDAGTLAVDLGRMQGRYRVEWFQPSRDRSFSAGFVAGQREQEFSPPFEDDGVLLLEAAPTEKLPGEG
jgi:hypothetical protein